MDNFRVPGAVTKKNMSQTDRTLLDQMHISDVEIKQRKELLELSEADAAYLVSCLERVSQNVDVLVKNFYVRIASIEENALLIGDADTLRRMHAAMRRYIIGLFQGHYDISYVQDRLQIGMVHKRMGVEPKWFLAAVKTLKYVLGRFLAQTIAERHTLANVLCALDKLLYFDTTLIVDTYIRSLLNEVELAKDRVLVYARDLEQRVVERTRQIEELSRRDVLTGLYNRRAFREFLHRELLDGRRHCKALCIAYFDIDDFKEINDSRGHVAGDNVLRLIGELLLRNAREIDFPCRWGGDEFCLVMPDCLSADAERVVHRLIAEFSTLGLGVTFSTGIVQSGPTEFLEDEEYIRLADEKMYKSKSKPGFCVTV